MRKGDEIFSKDELAALRMFAKNAVEEDKKLCGISDKNTKKIRKGDEIFSKHVENPYARPYIVLSSLDELKKKK